MYNDKFYTKTLLLIPLLLVVFFSLCCSAPQGRARSETYYRNAMIPPMPALHGRLIFYTTEKFPSPLTLILGGPIGVLLTLSGQDAFAVDLPVGWFTVKEDIMVSKLYGQTPSYNTIFKLDAPLGFGMFEGETKYLRLIHTSTAKWKVQFAEEGNAIKEFQSLIYSGYYLVDK